MASSENGSSGSNIPPAPSNIPPPTGNLLTDAYHSVLHVGDIPCARNSLLGGIASGLGIGIVRGMSASAFVAGNWACATFVLISLGSFKFCQSQLAKERETVTRVIESMPRRVVKESNDQSSS